MDVRFTVRARVARPVEEVFEAVVDPARLTSYFTKTASGALAPGAHVTWTWEGGQSESLDVDEFELHRRIVFRWRAYRVPEITRVEIAFEPDGNARTLVRVTESGWQPDQEGLDSAFEHCAGWQHMLLSLRARLVFGIDLRS